MGKTRKKKKMKYKGNLEVTCGAESESNLGTRKRHMTVDGPVLGP
jgi:hypothetical protein